MQRPWEYLDSGAASLEVPGSIYSAQGGSAKYLNPSTSPDREILESKRFLYSGVSFTIDFRVGNDFLQTTTFPCLIAFFKKKYTGVDPKHELV